MSGAARRSSIFSRQRTWKDGRPTGGRREEAAGSEASEWESMEREEHLAALREEEVRFGEEE